VSRNFVINIRINTPSPIREQANNTMKILILLIIFSAILAASLRSGQPDTAGPVT
jgi:hypothetical protein